LHIRLEYRGLLTVNSYYSFNSYTQQLCLNDVVRKPGGIKATEKDLRLQNPQADSSNKKDDSYMENQKGELVRRTKMLDGQKEVSQVVSWEAGFVDNISEVTEKLNIKGVFSQCQTSS
jgi:hypothetical protein